MLVHTCSELDKTKQVPPRRIDSINDTDQPISDLHVVAKPVGELAADGRAAMLSAPPTVKTSAGSHGTPASECV